MLDYYSWGKVDRISPEAPIPVMQVLREDRRLGGAGNVVMNLTTLGAEVLVCGVTGKDETGECIRKLLAENGVDHSGVIISENYKSCLKHRMIAGQTHLLRMDIDSGPETLVLQNQLVDYLEQTIPKCKAVIVSDYGKGLLSTESLKTIAACGKKHGIPIVGDPRRTTNYSIYQDFTLIKPNRKETEAAVGFTIKDQNDVLKAAEQLKAEVKLEYLVISLDRDGLLLFHNPEDYYFFEAETQEVFDVVGAGDMVSSMLTFMLAGQAKIEQAAYWAQLAASLEIQHVGVVSFTKNELLQRFDYGETSAKIVTQEKLYRNLPQEIPIVFTNGCFDIIHRGHVEYLNKAKKLGDILIVGINSDESIKKIKGNKRPIIPLYSRAYVLDNLKAVDFVVPFDEETPIELIKIIKPDVHVKGGDYKEEDLPEAEIVKSYGGEIKIIPLIEGFSTTKIIEWVLEKCK